MSSSASGDRTSHAASGRNTGHHNKNGFGTHSCALDRRPSPASRLASLAGGGSHRGRRNCPRSRVPAGRTTAAEPDTKLERGVRFVILAHVSIVLTTWTSSNHLLARRSAPALLPVRRSDAVAGCSTPTGTAEATDLRDRDPCVIPSSTRCCACSSNGRSARLPGSSSSVNTSSSCAPCSPPSPRSARAAPTGR